VGEAVHAPRRCLVLSCVCVCVLGKMLTSVVCVTSIRKGTRRISDLVWQGVPPSVRGQVWMLELSNNLQITAGKSSPFYDRIYYCYCYCYY
jgi:hypothetical protein